ENISAIGDALIAGGIRFVPLDGNCGPGVRLEIDVPKIAVRPMRVSFETGNLPFEASWRGKPIYVFLPKIVLNDLDRINHRGDDAYVASFAKHESLILEKTTLALYGGRADDEGRLQLRSHDFRDCFPR